jgi:hypothetical protein
MSAKTIIDSLQYTDFATYFANDFNYVLAWQNDVSYVINDLSYSFYTKAYKNQIYKAKTNNINKNPLTEPLEWEFLGLEANSQYVLQIDIESAMRDARGNFPYHLFEVANDDIVKRYFFLLCAFYISIAKSRTNVGLVSGSNRLVSSRTVGTGSVSESFETATGRLNKDFFYLNSYGQEYFDYIQTLIIAFPIQFAPIGSSCN